MPQQPPQSRQAGGSHYLNPDAPGPLEWATAWRLSPFAYSVVKYVLRADRNLKGTPLEDLEKAEHCLELLRAKLEREAGRDG